METEHVENNASEFLSAETVCVLGRNVATELGWSLVATSRPSCVRARLLRSDRAWLELGRDVSVRARLLSSDRAWLELGRYVATEPCACSVAT
ncbi:hypothetical protein DY000_02039606 [Brassica cretica]|uniref:Uncharacterized protein n=1 Tax=Brassica cretica TaxID=69181 RepID=A0ABQ7BBP7_BRACR|nr:hypothetical protein DY000_02039606 [Brassica cretica]